MRKNKALLRLLSNPAVIRRHYSPNISRSIPATYSVNRLIRTVEWGIVALVSGILVILILNISLQINHQVTKLSAQQAEKQKVESERTYWEAIISDYPGYRDAYYRLALVAYQLGDEQQALHAVDEAIRLDPMFTDGILFRAKLLSE